MLIFIVKMKILKMNPLKDQKELKQLIQKFKVGKIY